MPTCLTTALAPPQSAPAKKAATTFAPGIFKSEGMQVAAGVGGICVVGLVTAGAWFASIADKKPKTMTAQWARATAKYRAAQNQDPITNGGLFTNRPGDS